ncbi:MAG TPA: PilC/PilY family type IV pilus protein [Steroidobacteraceae bacterium]|nr:PilC/PilY family type IV pilus protein [Steroidobacteraceae bacterium]
MYCRHPRLAALAGGIALAVFCGSPALADDTEIFVGQQSGARPNILFILDTSGSMDSQVSTQPPYNPATTYNGTCDVNHVYWNRGGNNPPDCSNTNNWFNANELACDAAVQGISSAGRYLAQRAGQWDENNNRWDQVDNNTRDQPVECSADAGVHGETAGDPKVYAFNSGIANNRWTANPAQQVDWDNSPLNNSYTFFSGNWINWRNDTGNFVTRSRLEIVQDVAEALVSSISGVNIGLMRYSNNDGSGDARAEGGMVTHEVVPVESDRAGLITSISQNTAAGFTPLSETLYEANQYFSGGDVFYGRDCATGAVPCSQIEPGVALPSVPGSLEPGNPARYHSPSQQSCQKNYIVYLTDGEPTEDNSADGKIETLLGKQCTGTGPGRCLDDLAGYMHDNDLRTTIQGDQNVTTYTIGFGDDVEGTTFLNEVAAAGGGENFFAGDTESLTTVLTNIVNKIVNGSTTFVAPAVAVNAFNRTESLADLYISVFQPTETFHWPGNLKKYRVENSVVVGADTTADGNPDPAIDPITGFFSTGSKSFWSPSVDGADVTKGGAANEQPADSSQRKIYTFLGDNDLTAVANRVVSTNAALTDAVLGTGTPDLPTRAQLLDWTNGFDLRDINGDGQTTDARRQMGDPVHGKPAVVIYGGTAATPDVDDAVVYAPTNDGYLHAINAKTGAELWSFIPPELLNNLVNLYQDDPTNSKHYGLDGDVRAFKLDINQNGVVEPGNGDKVWLFFGMGRGGDHYYAIDVTDKNTPRRLWTLGPAELPGVGQTWSTPTLARVKISGTTQNSLNLVLVMGGGYDPTQDNDQLANFYHPDTLGNRIYMVDAESGALLWFAGGPGGAVTPDLTLTKMNNSIPAPIRVLDLDADGFADRMYAGDMGGRIWRFDIVTDADPATAGQQIPNASNLVAGGVLASLGNADLGTHPNTSARRFYQTPDVSLVRRRGAQAYLNIAVGSGWRGHPLNTDTQDRFYAVRDYQPFSTLAQADFNAFTAIADGDLVDITDSVNPLVPDGSKGWKLELRLPGGFDGEKVLAESRTFDNIIFFPTYLPRGAGAGADPCAPAGTNRAYAIAIDDGRPVIDRNRDGQTTTEDRYAPLATTGIAPEFSLLMTRQTQAGGGQGGPLGGRALTCLVGVEVVQGLCANAGSPVRTYWRQLGAK